MKLDRWQQEVLETKGNICLRSGRQVGKSTVIGKKAGDFAAKNKNKTVLVIASVERQAYLLFEKTLHYLDQNYRSMIKKGKDRPTKSRVKLTNGSVIYCLPTGLSGHGIRGYTIDLLIADEAAFIPEEVWTAVTPMLAVTQGDIILLSTPFGKGGYFYRCFSDDTFTSFHESSEDCPRIDPAFLEQEKKRMTKAQYAQEYLGEFVDELRQFFPTRLIERCMKLQKADLSNMDGLKKYLGVDVARMGRDDSVMFSLVLKKGILYQFSMVISSKTMLTETVRAILSLDKAYNYKAIYIDDGGMGVGVFDPLLEHKQTKRKVIGINNSQRSIEHDREDGRRKRLLKEDLYNNLLSLMEQDKIKLDPDPEIMQSLKSIQADYTEDGKLKIFGSYTHITEALIRAAWGIREKHLSIYLHYS